MINDLKLTFKLLKHGLSFKSSLLSVLFFFAIGIVFELFSSEMPIGGIYMLMGSIMIYQLVMSVSVSTMVQTSPYKKKLQTSLPALITCPCMLILNTAVVLVKIVSANMMNKSVAELSDGILINGILMVVVLIYMGAAMKAFWAATIVFALVFGVGYSLILNMMFDRIGTVPEMILPLEASIAVSYLCIIIGCILMYLVSLLLYKKDFSKTTFETALKRAK